MVKRSWKESTRTISAIAAGTPWTPSADMDTTRTARKLIFIMAKGASFGQCSSALGAVKILLTG